MFIPLMLLCKIYRIHVRIEVPPSSDKKLVLVHHIRRVCQFVYQLGGNLHFAQVQTAKKNKAKLSASSKSPLGDFRTLDLAKNAKRGDFEVEENLQNQHVANLFYGLSRPI